MGYQISPVLWAKVKRGLSAGRVQSVAVRLVAEREAEIRAFMPEEYWTIDADVEGSVPPPFTCRVVKLDGQKPPMTNEGEARAIVDMVQAAQLKVASVEKKERRKNPPPPFITSKLQQDASSKLRFSPKRTMGLAQRLYEGIELGEEGPVGLITYMRTDSTRLSRRRHHRSARPTSPAATAAIGCPPSPTCTRPRRAPRTPTRPSARRPPASIPRPCAS